MAGAIDGSWGKDGGAGLRSDGGEKAGVLVASTGLIEEHIVTELMGSVVAYDCGSFAIEIATDGVVYGTSTCKREPLSKNGFSSITGEGDAERESQSALGTWMKVTIAKPGAHQDVLGCHLWVWVECYPGTFDDGIDEVP